METRHATFLVSRDHGNGKHRARQSGRGELKAIATLATRFIQTDSAASRRDTMCVYLVKPSSLSV